MKFGEYVEAAELITDTESGDLLILVRDEVGYSIDPMSLPVSTATQTELDNEADTRAANDTALEGSIDDESAARIAADDDLQDQIDAHTVLIDTSMKKPEAFTPSGSYPTTYGGIAIQAGDTYRVAAGTMGAVNVNAEDLLIALIDTPGQTDANWQVIESNRVQATESVTGFAKISTQAIIETIATTNDTDIVTPKKFWQGITKFLTLAWTFAAKITFTTAPRFDSVTASEILEVDSSKELISAAKGTAYNKSFGTGAATVCEGNDSRLSNSRTILAMSWGTGGTVGTGNTQYATFMQAAATFNNTEANREMIVPISGTLKKFYLRTNTVQHAGGTFVHTVRINGADTTIIITQNANDVAATYSETSNGGSLHTVAINAGDRLSIKSVNAVGGTSASVTCFSIFIE